MKNYLPSILLFAVFVVSSAVAAPGDPCDVATGEVRLQVGESKRIGVFVVRLDSVDLKEKDADQYQISLKQDGMESILANHRLLVQHQSIIIKTKCGDLSIAGNRSFYDGYAGRHIDMILSFF